MLPQLLKRVARAMRHGIPHDHRATTTETEPHQEDDPAYIARLAAEIENFKDDVDIHALPDIFHYWSNKYLLETIRPFGFVHPDDFFIKQFIEVLASQSGRTARFISLGAGNCDTEVRIAEALRAAGHENFVLECLDLNPSMLARGRALAAQQGLDRHVVPVEGDFNRWRPTTPYHAVMANQALHHVLALEHLFDAVHAAIAPLDGVLITADMIGRNGHQRWPEARAIIDEFWAALPKRYKYNHQLRRYEEPFLDWDCAQGGFEGIRAQDILPLLIERFHFSLFVPFANVISPFIDRGFGHNFDATSADDRNFIDRVHARDMAEIQAGTVKPTQMFAVLATTDHRPLRCVDGLTPLHCLRVPTAA